jgi:hypothetical protein
MGAGVSESTAGGVVSRALNRRCTTL